MRAAFAARGDEIACVITEACPANMGIVPPADGFNQLLAELCRTHGALLIMDEVLTGFRVTRSGWYGHDPVAADLMTFGKVMGGGLPAAAFGGRAEIMDRLAPAGPVYQAGTLSGNPLATAAGLATLRACTDEVYARVDRAARAVAGLAADALAAAGVPFRAARGRAACSRSSSASTARSATSTTPGASPGRPTPRSSTPCWRAGCTCRRRRSRRGSCRPRTTTTPSPGIAAALPAAARAAARALG